MCRQARGTNVAEQVFGASNDTVFSEVLGKDHAMLTTRHHFARWNIKRRRALRHGHYRKERDFTHFRWAPSSTLFVPGLSHVQSETCCLALWGRGSHHGNVLGQHARRGSCL